MRKNACGSLLAYSYAVACSLQFGHYFLAHFPLVFNIQLHQVVVVVVANNNDSRKQTHELQCVIYECIQYHVHSPLLFYFLYALCFTGTIFCARSIQTITHLTTRSAFATFGYTDIAYLSYTIWCRYGRCCGWFRHGNSHGGKSGWCYG